MMVDLNCNKFSFIFICIYVLISTSKFIKILLNWIGIETGNLNSEYLITKGTHPA